MGLSILVGDCVENTIFIYLFLFFNVINIFFIQTLLYAEVLLYQHGSHQSLFKM